MDERLRTGPSCGRWMAAGDCDHGFRRERCPLCGDEALEVLRLPRGGEEEEGQQEGCRGEGAVGSEHGTGWAASWADEGRRLRGFEAEREGAFVEGLEGLERVLRLREELGAALSRGGICLAQARYSLGPNRVGEAHFPASFSAEARVRARSGGGGAFDLIEEERPSGSDPGAPLAWFGPMPPPALRSARDEFRAALRLTVELAQAQVAAQRAAAVFRGSSESEDRT